MSAPRTTAAVPRRILPLGREVVEPARVRATLATEHARTLADVLRAGDPMRASFDVAVRRYVRAERAEGRDLDTILASIAEVLRTHVAPSLPPERAEALQRAVAWFTVSEYHRGP